MEAQNLQQLTFAVDTFYLLISGALVMWMAAGFSMLEAGLVRSKNTTEILTKNIVLYAIACIVYLVIGYKVMYPDPSTSAYAADANFFFSDGVRCYCYVDSLRCRCRAYEANELSAFLCRA